MNLDESTSQKIAWGPWIIAAVGCVILLLGVGRFVVKHSFGLRDALYCCLAVIPTYLLLLIFDYVIHHAKLASVVLLAMAGVLVFSSPVFDIALGLTLIGTIAGTAL